MQRESAALRRNNMRTPLAPGRPATPMRAVLAVLAATALLAGCGGTAGVAQGPGTGSTAGTPSGSSPAGTSAGSISAGGVGGTSAGPRLSGTGPAIVLAAKPATIGGPLPGSTTTVFADGRVQRSTAEGLGVESFTVPVGQVQTVVDQAYAAGLFDSPQSGIAISDVGTTTLTLTVGGRSAEVSVDGTVGPAGPEGTVGTDSDPVVAAVADVQSAIATWQPGADRRVSYRDDLLVRAEPTTSQPDAPGKPWPLATGPERLFAAGACARLGAADTERLANAAAGVAPSDAPPPAPSGSRGRAVLPTGDPAMPFVEIDWSPRASACAGSGRPVADPYAATNNPDELSTLPGEHRPAGGWDRLVAASALSLEDERQRSVYTATVDGEPVLDVYVRGEDTGANPDREFRIDRTTGDVVADHPVR